MKDCKRPDLLIRSVGSHDLRPALRPGRSATAGQRLSTAVLAFTDSKRTCRNDGGSAGAAGAQGCSGCRGAAFSAAAPSSFSSSSQSSSAACCVAASAPAPADRLGSSGTRAVPSSKCLRGNDPQMLRGLHLGPSGIPVGTEQLVAPGPLGGCAREDAESAAAAAVAAAEAWTLCRCTFAARCASCSAAFSCACINNASVRFSMFLMTPTLPSGCPHMILVKYQERKLGARRRSTNAIVGKEEQSNN